jgi:hypothetical protein
MKGAGWSLPSICGPTVSSMLGQNGRQRSRNLICSLMRSATPGTLGQPRMERPPRARGPNSMRPWNQATGLPSASRRAMRCGTSSIFAIAAWPGAGAGGDDFLVAVGRAEIDVLHLLHRHAALHRDVGGRADGGAGIARGRLHEEFLHLGAGDDLLVELDVERAAAGEGQPAGLAQDVAEVVVHHLQRQVLEQLLHARRVVDVGVVGDVADALRGRAIRSAWARSSSPCRFPCSGAGRSRWRSRC